MRAATPAKITFAAALVLLSNFTLACDRSTSPDAPAGEPGEAAPKASEEPVLDGTQEAPEGDADTTEDERSAERQRMVREQIEARGIDDPRVLDAMRTVPRHRYVPDQIDAHAYRDRPLPIGLEQTISQPFIVAMMSELLETSPGDRVLEIGTGSGYQAAVLAEMDTEVYTIEILCELAERAERDLEATGYGDDIEVKCGDGYQGWPEYAPFDRIIVTAAPPEIPEALVEQLAIGGRMVVPVGEEYQLLQLIEKIDDDTVDVTDVEYVRFVPMVPGER